MQLHQIKPIHKAKKSKEVGRGGAHGHYSCHGASKGQKSSNDHLRPIIKELIKKYPKLRGYRFKSLTEKPFVLNLETLDKKFKSGDRVSPQILIEKRIIRSVNGLVPKIKILGGGKIDKSLIFESCMVSDSAKAAIEKAGGEIK